MAPLALAADDSSRGLLWLLLSLLCRHLCGSFYETFNGNQAKGWDQARLSQHAQCSLLLDVERHG
jgi:hypothetical protein